MIWHKGMLRPRRVEDQRREHRIGMEDIGEDICLTYYGNREAA